MNMTPITRRAALAGITAFAARPSFAAPAELRVGAALPDPPFELMTPDGPAGFDIDLMRAIARRLGRDYRLVPYRGGDFNGIFAGLPRDYDCVASGATVTPARATIVDFCAPYVVSGQSLVVDVKRHPQVRSTGDLRGLVIGVQQGNTSEPVARRLVAEGRAARVRVYPYDAIATALDDLSTGGCDAFMKLAPVMHWMVRGRPALKVVQTGITRELLAVCVAKGDAPLRDAINAAQAALRAGGTLARLVTRWLGEGAEVAAG